MNFGNTIIIHHFRPENPLNPTQKDMNFLNTIIIRYFRPENPLNPTQKDMNFRNTIIIRHFGPENPLNPTQKDMNFGNTIIIHHFGPENPQNPTQKDRNFEKMHSLTSTKMPTNKESIHFSRILHFLHHDSNAPINLIQHQPTNHFLGTPSNTFFEICRPIVIYLDSITTSHGEQVCPHGRL